jgi:hypothetical protein
MFNKANLAVAGCVSKAATYSKNVLFHKGGTVATDGHIVVSVSPPSMDIKDAPMIAGEYPTLDYGEFTLDVESIKKIKKGFGKKAFPILENAFIIGAGDTRRLVSTDLSSVVSVPVSEENGPPKAVKELDKMTPGGEPTLTIIFNADLMIRFMSILAEAQGGQYSKPVVLKIWDSKSAVKAEAENIETGQKIIGLIMPFQKQDLTRPGQSDRVI